MTDKFKTLVEDCIEACEELQYSKENGYRSALDKELSELTYILNDILDGDESYLEAEGR